MQCSQIEALERKCDYLNMDKKVKEAAGIVKKIRNIVLKDINWDKIVFADEQRQQLTFPAAFNGQSITKVETVKALEGLNDGKSLGSDNTYGKKN